MFNNPYEFDLDKNGMLAITYKNIEFMEGIIKSDSNYRRTRDDKYEDYSYAYIKKSGISQDYNVLFEQIKRIDKENSTHLAVSGKEKNSNQGREKTAQYISTLSNLKERFVLGDGELVNEIAKNSVPRRNNFSFASKFCAYVTEFAFDCEKNKYCIFDDVVANILPYYAWYYLGERHIAKKNSTIKKEFMDNVDYVGYRNLIDRIIQKIKEVENVIISYREFDHLLWYYYKGDKFRIQNALNYVK